MKRFITFISVAFLICSVAFSETSDNDSKHIEKVPGLSFSVFGIEPSFLLGINHAEFIFSCAVASDDGFSFSGTGTDSSAIVAVTPKIHVGYNFETYDTGWNNSIGFAYASAFGFLNPGIENMEAFAMYYKGEVRFKLGLGLGVTSYLPLFYFRVAPDYFDFKTIGSAMGFWECIGYGFLSTSFNLRWYF